MKTKKHITVKWVRGLYAQELRELREVYRKDGKKVPFEHLWALDTAFWAVQKSLMQTPWFRFQQIILRALGSF